jgi:integrase/recombinase XerD
MDDLQATQLTDEEKARMRLNLRKGRAALRAPITPVITIFVRHSADCKYLGDEFCKRCNCRKHFRWTLGGTQYRRKAGTRSWAEAEDVKRRLEDQLTGRKPERDAAEDVQTIQAAKDAFLLEKQVAEISADAQGKYKLEISRFVSFCESAGVFTLDAVTVPLLTSYKASWPALYESTYTRAFVQKRLRVFLRFCHNAGWLDRVPKMSPVKIAEPPTLPLTEKEYKKLLRAVPLEFTNGSAKRVRALIQLMRWSGLAVRDASCIKRTEILKHKSGHYGVMTKRQKTGTDVYVPIPAEVGEEVLAAAANENTEYIFWTPGNTSVSQAHDRSNEISRVFTKAGIESQGHMVSHRLRDTFACHLLENGIPLEEVSKMLGHESIVTTEKHYSKWIKGRQDRLDNLVTAVWKSGRDKE